MPSSNPNNKNDILTPRNIGIGILSLIILRQIGSIGSNAIVFILVAGGMSSLFVPTEKFDARKEMKLVYKGDWLPDEKKKEVEKNKTWFEKGVESVLTSIQGEATVAFETKSIVERNFIAFKLITLTLHNGEEYHWIGAFQKYHFLAGIVLSIILPLEKIIYGNNNGISNDNSNNSKSSNTRNSSNSRSSSNNTNNTNNSSSNSSNNNNFKGPGRKLGKE